MTIERNEKGQRKPNSDISVASTNDSVPTPESSVSPPDWKVTVIPPEDPDAVRARDKSTLSKRADHNWPKNFSGRHSSGRRMPKSGGSE